MSVLTSVVFVVGEIFEIPKITSILWAFVPQK
jgi:hypothetical protein